MEYGIAHLKRKLGQKRLRTERRYKYYEMKNHIEKQSGIIPVEYRSFSETLGWCTKAVDSIANRLAFDGFDGDIFNVGEIFRMNNGDILFDSAILSALISSCSFIYIAENAEGYPTLKVIDGSHATGIIDESTGLLTEGYAVIRRDQYDRPIEEAYFRPFQTDYYENGRFRETLMHDAPHPLLVPVINQPDAKRPFGHSRISRACMALTQAALRTLQRSEVSAEFYSVPQKYILGLDDEAEFNGRNAAISSFISFGRGENGTAPSVGQFQQQSMNPHLEQLKSIASLFAGETGLTLDDLGFATSNPSSFDAIRASHENLRQTAKSAQKSFGIGFVNAGYLAACIRDRMEYDRRAFVDTRALWLPVFEPDAAALGGIGDAIYKINEAVPGLIGAKSIRRLTGLEVEDNDV